MYLYAGADVPVCGLMHACVRAHVCLCAYVWAHACMLSVGDCRPEEDWSLGNRRLNHQTWLLAIKLGSSGKAASAVQP